MLPLTAVDVSSDFSIVTSKDGGFLKALYFPAMKTVFVEFALCNGSGTTKLADCTNSKYRPIANHDCHAFNNPGAIITFFADNGEIHQNITMSAQSMYAVGTMYKCS